MQGMDSVTTYDELKDLIGRTYPDMSKQLQRIARFALEQPNDLALGTVATVAEATEVQPSAMIRFARLFTRLRLKRAIRRIFIRAGLPPSIV